MRFNALILAILSTTICCSAFSNCHEHTQQKISAFNQYQGYSQQTYNSWVRTSQYITSGDVKLAVDIIRPAQNGKVTQQRLPAIVMQTPYQRAFIKNDGSIGSQLERHSWQNIVKHGYVFAIFAARGTAASFGKYTMPVTQQERDDAKNIIEWLAKQPYTNGKIGMMGDSYQGLEQYMAVSTHPKHLKAIFAQTSPFDLYQMVYPGGIFRSSFITYWAHEVEQMNQLNQLVPVDKDPNGLKVLQAREQHKQNLDVLKQFADVPYRDSNINSPVFNWTNNNPITYLEQINRADIPVYLSDSWYDVFTSDALFWYANLTGHKKMLIGAWPHNTYNAPTAIRQQRERINNTEALRWFDYWLKGIDNHIMQQDPINYSVISQDYHTSNWHSAQQWPVKNITQTHWYLNAKHTLTTQQPSTPGHDDYAANYNTSTGHLSRWNNANGAGFINYVGLTANDKKSLTYTTKPLSQDMTLLGFPVLALQLSSDRPNIDLHAVLEAVDKKGQSHYITEGMLRLSSRKLSKAPWNNFGLPYHSFNSKDQQDIPQGKRIKVKLYLYPTARVIKKGERLRLVLMNADMNNTETLAYPNGSRMTIYTGKGASSTIILPTHS